MQSCAKNHSRCQSTPQMREQLKRLFLIAGNNPLTGTRRPLICLMLAVS